jgi:hypothetical protein
MIRPRESEQSVHRATQVLLPIRGEAFLVPSFAHGGDVFYHSIICSMSRDLGRIEVGFIVRSSYLRWSICTSLMWFIGKTFHSGVRLWLNGIFTGI